MPLTYLIHVQHRTIGKWWLHDEASDSVPRVAEMTRAGEYEPCGRVIEIDTDKLTARDVSAEVAKLIAEWSDAHEYVLAEAVEEWCRSHGVTTMWTADDEMRAAAREAAERRATPELYVYSATSAGRSL